MIPFNQNQSSSVPPRAPAPHNQQIPGAQLNMFPNLMQIQPQMGFINPQLSNPFNNNNNNNNGNGFNLNSDNGGRNPGFMNMPNLNALQQNSLLGSFQGLPQNTGFMGNGQVGIMGQNMIPGNGTGQGFVQNSGFMGNGQNMNQLGGVMLNPAQVAALSQLMGCVNQVAQGMVPQNSTFLGNPQLGLLQPNAGGLQQQGSFGQQLGSFGQQLPVVSQQSQNVPSLPTMPFTPALIRPQNNQPWNFQNLGNHGKKQGMHNANGRHNQNKNFTKNPRREASNGRSQTQQMNNGGKGTENADPDNSTNQTNSGKKPLFLLYTEKEIQKWREERKKHYPTKENFQKKLSEKQANADAAAEEAKLRREQLKEVLTKQAELGLETLEIPSHYMLDNEDLSRGKGNHKRPFNNGRRQNKFNKRGRFDKSNRFRSNRGTEAEGNNVRDENDLFATKPKRDNKSEGKTPIREPTLLQKLLSSDIKRDNNRLLQAFRFMVMNSFFTEKTDDSLNFPKVVVEERTDGVNEDCSSMKELSGGIEAHVADVGCQEEGEITD